MERTSGSAKRGTVPGSDEVGTRRIEGRLLVFGAVVTAIGFVVAAAGPRDVGGAMLLAGWILFGGALHRYGRLGADALEGEPEVLDEDTEEAPPSSS